MGLALPYIFVSQAMFPYRLDGGGSLEDYYLRHSRVLMGVLMLPPAVSSLAYNISDTGWGTLQALTYQGPRLLIPFVLAAWPNRWAHRIGIALLCLFMMALLFV